MLAKKQLLTVLKTLEGFVNPKPKLEQYVTPPGIAADLLEKYAEHITNKTVLDLGSGTGLLGIGALLIGAKKVIFIEKDKDAATILEKNLTTIIKEQTIVGTYTIIPEELNHTDEHADTVLMNPPFGTREEHADTTFLDYALTHSSTTITMHKTSTCNHIRYHVNRLRKKIVEEKDIQFTLKHTMRHHTKPSEKVAVTVFVIQ